MLFRSVTFDIDSNGFLHVAAKDRASGKEQNIRITASSGLDKSEIEKMRREAQENASEDKKRKEEIEQRNQADNLIYSTDKQIKDLGDKIPADHLTKIEAAKERLADAIKNNPSDIRAATDALNTAWSDASTQMYSQAGAAPGDGQPGNDGQQSQSSEPKVEEADYTIVDEK